MRDHFVCGALLRSSGFSRPTAITGEGDPAKALQRRPELDSNATTVRAIKYNNITNHSATWNHAHERERPVEDH